MAVLHLWEKMKIVNFIHSVDPKALHKHSVYIPLCVKICHTRPGVRSHKPVASFPQDCIELATKGMGH